MDTVSGQVTLPFLFCLPSQHSSSIKGNFMSKFFNNRPSFWKGFIIQGSKQEVSKLDALGKMLDTDEVKQYTLITRAQFSKLTMSLTSFKTLNVSYT